MPEGPSPDTPDALERLRRHLDAAGGRIGEAELDLGVKALEVYLASGAVLGRGLRREIGKMRPVDECGAQLSYLFVLTVDAATHEGRTAPLAAYASSGARLSDAAARLLAILESDAFRNKLGWRPTLPGERRPPPH